MANVMVQEKVRVEGRNVSLYPQDWEAVEKVAREMGGSVSSGLRYILRDWQRAKFELTRQQDRLRIAEAHLAGKITDLEAAEALGLPIGGDGDESD